MKRTLFFLIVALIATITICVVLFREWRNESKEKATLQQQYDLALLSTDATPLVVYDTIFDTVDNTVQFKLNPVQTTGNVGAFVSKGVVDTMAKALNVAVREIERLNSKVITMEGKGKGERLRDTVTKTEWLVLKNDPSFDVKVNLGNDSIYPGVRLKLTQAYAPYRRNLFSRTEYRSVIRASDHRVRISEVYDVNKIPRSPRWSLGVFGGPLVTANGFSYGLGLGLTYDLIQF